MASNINIKNKKASHDFEFVEKYIAGIVLTGTEIKSIRVGKANISDAFCYFKDGEIWVKNIHVAEYSHGGYVNHDPARDRKLLMNKREIAKLQKKVKERGFSLVATRLFIADSGYAKLNIALAKGKREYDKRETIKKKDTRRQYERLNKL